MSSIIKLVFYNESNIKETPRIVLFQKQLIAGFQIKPVAWKVFVNLAQGFRHPFEFPPDIHMSVKDSVGTQVGGLIDVKYGQGYTAVEGAKGNKIVDDLLTITMVNQVSKAPLNAEILRGGDLLAIAPDINPKESVVFQFDQAICVGIANNVNQGEILNNVSQTKIHTRLDLAGINTAEIVMAGGGTQPLSFNLRNIT